jgi:hypothetical protein
VYQDMFNIFSFKLLFSMGVREKVKLLPCLTN